LCAGTILAQALLLEIVRRQRCGLRSPQSL
jgi:hypothetical protein